MHRKKHLSPTHEMYLKVLYQVRGPHHVARVRDLADGLGVSPGTVSASLKKLEQLRFVDHDRYGTVALTPAGSNVAECVVHRFETLRSVLVEIFGIDPATAAVDACMMEHAVSPTTVNRMETALRRVRSGRSLRGRRQERAYRCRDCEMLGECQAVAAAAHDGPELER
jgi:DtxR family Mn-dependent transcriptional regulator